MTLHILLNALSGIPFISLLKLRLWNIQTKGQYPNWVSMKAFMNIVFLLTFMKGIKRARALRFLQDFDKDY